MWVTLHRLASYVVVVLLLTVSLALSGACSEGKQDPLEERQAAQDTTMEELASEFGAIIGWEDSLEDDDLALTIDIQEAFIDTGPPIGFVGRLVDIRRTPNGVFAIFERSSYYEPEIYFRLSLSPNFVESLRAARRDTFRKKEYHNNIAVIAQVTGVRSPDITMRASAEEYHGYLSVDIYPVPSRTFVADGELLAFHQFTE
jgi:hypothetical protein